MSPTAPIASDAAGCHCRIAQMWPHSSVLVQLKLLCPAKALPNACRDQAFVQASHAATHLLVHRDLASCAAGVEETCLAPSDSLAAACPLAPHHVLSLWPVRVRLDLNPALNESRNCGSQTKCLLELSRSRKAIQYWHVLLHFLLSRPSLELPFHSAVCFLLY